MIVSDFYLSVYRVISGMQLGFEIKFTFIQQ